jgi:hypothetical protein
MITMNARESARWLGRGAVAALALLVIQGLAHSVIPGRRVAPPAAGGLGWILASNLLVALVLTHLAARLELEGGRLWGALFLVQYGIQFNNLIEAAVFPLFIPARELARLFGTALAASLVFTLLLTWRARAGSWQPSVEHGSSAAEREPRFSRGATFARRWAVGAVAYVAVYFAAGMIAYPYVRELYAGRPMPGVLPLALLQLARGSLFMAILLPVVRRVAVDRLPLALKAGATLSVVGGIAPLLIPNPYFPDAVRWAHLVEVGLSNFLYGFLVARLLGPEARPKQRSTPLAVNPPSPEKPEGAPIVT